MKQEDLIDRNIGRSLTCCKIAAKGNRKINPLVLGYAINPDYRHCEIIGGEKIVSDTGFYAHVYCHVYCGPKMNAYYAWDGFDETGRYDEFIKEENLNLFVPEWLKETYFYKFLKHIRDEYMEGKESNFVRYEKLTEEDLALLKRLSSRHLIPNARNDEKLLRPYDQVGEWEE